MFRAKTTFEALARTSVEAYFHSVSIMRDADAQPALQRRLQGASWAATTRSEVFERHAAQAGTDDPLALIQYLDLKTYLVGDINTKVDRASMAHSLEVREPLMDHPLVEWLATLPIILKMRGAEGKYLLKKAMEPHLPHDIMYRPKMGFAVPLARWFRGPLRAARARRSCSAAALAGHRLVQPRRYLRQLVEQHESGSARPQHADLDVADVRCISQKQRRINPGVGERQI